jgi:hypothetical protein
MTAKGKINASKVQANDRIIVALSLLTEGRVNISQTKTGEGVQVARVITKTFRMVFIGRRQNRVYVVHTTAGSFQAAPIETMWLAPEDPAGIKRAHAEALAKDRERAAELAERAAMVELDELPDPDGVEDLTLTSHAGKVGHVNNDASTSTWLKDAGAEKRYRESVATDPKSGPDHRAQIASASNKSPALATDTTGSAVVELLETVWDRIRENHPQLPAVVIVTGSGMVGSSKWGHFRRDGWATVEGATIPGKLDEMFMAGETLAKGARQVLQTMLHEGAHTLAKVREVQDTSRQGRWHNAKFKSLAEEMGLEHKAAAADKAIGFSCVTLTAETAERYADLLTELDAAIRLVVHLPGWLGGSDEDDKGGELIGKAPRKTEPGSSSSLKLVCQCEEPNVIRTSRKVADKLVVKCDDCDEMFGEASI